MLRSVCVWGARAHVLLTGDECVEQYQAQCDEECLWLVGACGWVDGIDG